MTKIGLTGGIATGKTTVAHYLKDLGFKVIEADQIAREVLDLYPEILEYLRETYGERIFTQGILNRKELGKIIFQDEKKRESYRRVIMPRIIEEIRKRLQDHDEELIFLDAPLLFEEGLDQDVDYTLTVYVNPSVQLKRLMKRDGYTEDEAHKRIQAQMSLDEKANQSDYILNNEGEKEETFKALEQILHLFGWKNDSKNHIKNGTKKEN